MTLSFARLLSAARMGCATMVGRALILAFLLPLALGPALSPLVTALGGAPEHLCACGMKEGTCGCPECERQNGLTPGRAAGDVHAALSSCDDHRTAVAAPGGGALASILPASIVVHASPLVTTTLATAAYERAPRGPDAPPTRPPRA